jgi:hypothetical protein
MWESADTGMRVARGWIPRSPEGVITRADRESIERYVAMMSSEKFTRVDAATRALLMVAVSKGATIAFAAEVCDIILRFETDIVGIISQPKFLNEGKFINVIVIGARVARKLQMKPLLEAIAVHILDEKKRRIITCKDKVEEAFQSD